MITNDLITLDQALTSDMAAAQRLRKYLNEDGGQFFLTLAMLNITISTFFQPEIAWITFTLVCIFIFSAHRTYMSPMYFKLIYKLFKSQEEKMYLKIAAKECYTLKHAVHESIFGLSCYMLWGLSITYAIVPKVFTAQSIL
jgi:hypothetical protein